MLGTDMLPHTNSHEHHLRNIDSTGQCGMGRKCVALAGVRDDPALMQLGNLDGEQVLLLPKLRIDE